jgi:hypothetical protein
LRTGLGMGPLPPPFMRLPLLLPILVAVFVVDADWFLGLGLILGEGVEEAPICGLDPLVGLISGIAAVKLPPPLLLLLLVIGVLGKLFAAKFDAEPTLEKEEVLDDDDDDDDDEVLDGDREANGSSTFPVIIVVVVVVEDEGKDPGKDERVLDIKLDPKDVCGNGLLDPFDDLKELAGLRAAGIIGDDVNDLWRADGDEVDGGGGGITPLLIMVPILCDSDKFSDIRALAASVASKLNGPILSK